MKEKMNILAFETSCDDTSVAVVTSDYEVLSNLISSQPDHNAFGGVVPELASRLHMKNIMPLTNAALKQAGVSLEEIDLIAVSVNPGLIGSLLVGLSFAKSLAWSLKKPFITVNHMLGHVYANKISSPDLEPPFLALVVSGGHTELVNFVTEEQFHVVGRTRDDAAGEAFDKVAKLLGLGYPGGPIIDKLAKDGDPTFHAFPRALNQHGNFDFSFSGLKTSITTYLKNQSQEYIDEHKADIVASLQAAIVDILVKKTLQFARQEHIPAIIIAGGVSANSSLRQQMTEQAARHKIKVFVPPLRLCMDNAAMIAAAAVYKYKRGDFAGLEANAFSTKGVRHV